LAGFANSGRVMGPLIANSANPLRTATEMGSQVRHV